MPRKFREPEDTTRQKMSIKKQGAANPMYNKTMPEDVKQKISQSLKRYWNNIPSKNNNKNNTETA